MTPATDKESGVCSPRQQLPTDWCHCVTGPFWNTKQWGMELSLCPHGVYLPMEGQTPEHRMCVQSMGDGRKSCRNRWPERLGGAGVGGPLSPSQALAMTGQCYGSGSVLPHGVPLLGAPLPVSTPPFPSWVLFQ